MAVHTKYAQSVISPLTEPGSLCLHAPIAVLTVMSARKCPTVIAHAPPIGHRAKQRNILPSHAAAVKLAAGRQVVKVNWLP